MTRPTRVQDGAFGGFHLPAVGDSFPGLVLIHDVWGPSDHSRALAEELASEGFAVVEIDLYREMAPLSIEDPGAHIRSLSDPAIVADLEAAADWLAAQPCCEGRKIGVMGVCMGGTFTLLAACLGQRFAAAVAFYGILSYEEGMLAQPSGRDRIRKPLSPIEAGGRLTTPLLASFGHEDTFIPLEDVAALEAALSKSGVSFEIDRYPGARHAFLNRSRPEAYREDAAAAAWARVIPFLHAELD
ncbi:MAG: dienelactone hydrolase family protein [bacterium]|nr:dienelactone hydrolase family protein [bacterium]